MTDEIAPGIYFGMEEQQYHSICALSNTGIKHLYVSPLNYWHQNLNPDFEGREETKALRFGRAAHCLALEPERFSKAYAPAISPADYPGALVTTDDLKAFLEQNGLPKSAKRKQDLIDRIKESELDAIIWDIEMAKHAEVHAGKEMLGKDEWSQLHQAAKVIRDDPYAGAALTGGLPEVSFVVREPRTGALLKARMDYVKPDQIIDLKTFSNSRGKPTAQAVFDAIYYEGYHQQCVFYSFVRDLARKQLAAKEIGVHGEFSEAWLDVFLATEAAGFTFVFLESSAPFDLQLVQMRQAEAPGGDVNVYWQAAEMRIGDMIDLYVKCLDRFGDEPWREWRQPHVLLDTDMPQLMFAS